jgi:multidrug resistance efflux pump
MWKSIFAAAVVVVLLVGLLVYSQMRHEPLKVSGFVEADEVRLGSRLGGRVAEVLVEEGQQVAPGDLLVRLEPFDLDEQRAQAAANLAARQAELEKLVNGFRPEEIAQAKARVDRLTAKVKRLVDGPREEEINAAEARVTLAVAQLELATRNYQRTSSLFARETGAVSREDVDKATEELKVTQANKLVREQELQLLKKGTRAEEIAEARAELDETQQAWELTKNGFRTEDIKQAEAAVAESRAALDAIDVHVGELQVTSPVHGIVEALELRPGDLVMANAPVLSLIDTSRLWVRAFVPENRLDIQLGEQFSVTVDSYPDQQFLGEVTYVSPQAEFTPSNVQTPEERSKQVFRIKVTLKEGLEKLRPGMAADVWLER